MYECPNCGGELRFDIATQKLLCSHCRSSVDYTELKEESSAKQDTEDVSIFRCPNCGGEVMSTNLTASEYCTYCGAFVMLERKKGKMERADVIVPFKKTKEEVKELYRKTVGRKIYAPSAMRDPEFLDRFRGIYMPYWLYDVDMGPDIRLTAKTSTQKGDYKIEQMHIMTCESEIRFDGIPYDASSTFRDNLGQAVTPYESGEMIPFTPAVMLGFYSDRPDTPADTYEDDALEAAVDAAFDRIVEEAGFKKPKPERPESVKGTAKQLNARVTGTRSAFLPVWFLTWRNKDRVAYSVVNGQTGEVCAEMPVDFGKYLLFSLLLAVPLFFLTQAFLTVTSYTILILAGFMAAGMGQLYNWQLKRIAEREMHGDDKGYLRVHPDVKKRFKNSAASEGSLLGTLLGAVLAVLLEIPLFALIFGILIWVWLTESFATDSTARLVVSGGMILLTALTVPRSLSLSKEMEEKHAWAGGLGTAAAAVVSAVITFIHPVSDLWYYGGTIFAILAVLVSVFFLIYYYNLLVTCPVPHLFDRNTGDGTEKQYAAFGKGTKAKKRAETEQNAGGNAAEGNMQRSAGDVPEGTEESGKAKGKPTVISGEKLKQAVASDAVTLGGILVSTVVEVALIFLLVAAVLVLIFLGSEAIGFAAAPPEAAGQFAAENSATGYRTYLEDGADLFTPEEEEKLKEELLPITEYGHAAVITATVGGMDTSVYAGNRHYELFGPDASGVVFLIDMGNRNIWIASDGAIYGTITKGYANTICDNVYRYATDEEYYLCASKALEQIYTVLEGGRIAEPMKRITGVLLSLLLSCLLNYFFVILSIGVSAPEGAELAEDVIGPVAVAGAAQKLGNTYKTYNPVSKGSGGSSGGGGGGGGGGGFSGGGGGHGF